MVWLRVGVASLDPATICFWEEFGLVPKLVQEVNLGRESFRAVTRTLGL